MSVVIIDYGVGNLRSVYRAIRALSVPVVISADTNTIQSADVIVLPGQGAFETAVHQLRALNLFDYIRKHILEGKPYLGICLGFQLLFTESFENGHHAGLDIFPGAVKHFDTLGIDPRLSVPHMGWNSLSLQAEPNRLFPDPDMAFYFVHSYAVTPEPNTPIATQTTYGVPFISSVQRGSLLATQFHPEKSGDQGLALLRSFFETLPIEGS